MQKPRSRASFSRRILAFVWGFLGVVGFCRPASAQDWRQNPNNPSQIIDYSSSSGPTEHAPLARDKRWHGLTFGIDVGGVWGGVYATERSLTREADIHLIYEDGHEEPVDYSLWSVGFFGTYEYGPERLRLQATVLARIDTQTYGAGAEGYEQLSGSSIISTRYSLLVGPAFNLLSAPNASLDAGIGVGGVLGSYQRAAAVVDSWAEVGGEQSVNRPDSQSLSGVGGRIWLSGMICALDRHFGLGIGIYYDVDWLRADLPDPWPHSWVDQSLGVMVPVSTRF